MITHLGLGGVGTDGRDGDGVVAGSDLEEKPLNINVSTSYQSQNRDKKKHESIQINDLAKITSANREIEE